MKSNLRHNQTELISEIKIGTEGGQYFKNNNSNLRWRLAQYFEKKWWNNYLRKKSPPEYLKWKENYWKELLEKVQLIDKGKNLTDSCSVLDAGCGPAGIFMALENYKVTASDPLLKEYRLHHNFFDQSNYRYVTFLEKRIEDFEFENIFDVVFCMNVINHVYEYNLALDKLIHSLKPKGLIVLTIDAHNFSFFRFLFRMIPGDILHPHQFNLKEYSSHLTARGIRILKIEKLKKEFFFDHYLIVGEKK